MSRRKGSKRLNDEEEEDEGPEFFETLGRKESSLLSFKKNSGRKRSSRQTEDDGHLDGDVTMLEEDEDNYESSSSSSSSDEESEKNPLIVDSFAKRKSQVEDMIKQGVVYSELPAEKGAHVPIQLQADLDLYSFEEQQRRWEAGHSPEFLSLCMDLWRLVRSSEQDDTLGKEKYIELISRFHYICCPPPLEADKVLQSANEDWVNDSHGQRVMDYPAFFQAMYQCVDIWTETSELEEYIALLKRLITGAAVRLSDNSLIFKKKEHVKYDEYFGKVQPASESAKAVRSAEVKKNKDRSAEKIIQAAFRRKYERKKFEIAKRKVRTAQRIVRNWLGERRYKSPYSQRRTSREDNEDDEDCNDRFVSIDAHQSLQPSESRKRKTGPSDVKIAADQVLHRSHRRSAREALLSQEQTNLMIAKCYQAKLQADAAAQRAQNKGKRVEKSVRFDLFVVKFFKRSHGTIGIARRHLRLFVRSIEALLGSPEDQQQQQQRGKCPVQHPRIALFAEIVGISIKQHNARLCPSFLMPVLKSLYPDVVSVVRLMSSSCQPIPIANMLEALQSALPPALKHSEYNTILKSAIEPAKVDNKLIQPDQALWLALPTFKTLDTLAAYRRRRCASVAQVYAKRCVEELRRRRRERGLAESPMREEANGDEDPLMKKKLADARLLDAQINTTTSENDKPEAPDCDVEQASKEKMRSPRCNRKHHRIWSNKCRSDGEAR